MIAQLPEPEFWDPANAEIWGYRPAERRLLDRAVAWRERFDLAASANDRLTVRLLLVDVQKDFCFPDGALYVGGLDGRGAVDDNVRLASFIYRNLSLLTEIVCTLDTHLPFQIFFPSFWLAPDGRPPTAHRVVTADDVRAGRLSPNPSLAAWLARGDQDWLRRQALSYCERLEEDGRHTLYLWPPHCLLGSEGHALAGIIQEARLFHAFARLASDPVDIKGRHALTEHYSALSPEVLEGPDGEPLAAPNTALLRRLLSADALIIAGQAASHCVRSTIEDLLRTVPERDPDVMNRVYILEDCMSAVTVPDPETPGRLLHDFTGEAREALDRFQDAGMNVVRSTDPPTSWPDFPVEARPLEAEG